MTVPTRRDPQAEDLLRGIAGGPLGLFVDDVTRFHGAGGSLASGKWAVLPDGRAFPILCGDFVERRYPEGERYTDRCGDRVMPHEGQCEHHKASLDAYRSLSEAERVALEIREDMEDAWR